MDSDDVKDRLMQAAGKVFAERGYQSATVREICAAAGVNGASVNYYFRDKETLYVETVKCARQLRAAQYPMPEWPPGTPAEQRLLDFTTTLLRRMIAGDRAAWNTQLMFREVLQPTRACMEMVEQYIRPLFEQLMQIVRELFGPSVPEHQVRQIAFGIIGQCMHYRVAGEVVRMLTPEDEYQRHYSPEQLAELITNTVLSSAGLRPPIGQGESSSPKASGGLETRQTGSMHGPNI